MIKPDLINVWPKNCDYPIWRQFIAENRDKFNLVITIFMEPNKGPDFSPFVREAMRGGYNLFVESPPVPSGGDWRDVAINAGLLHAHNAEWLWFTEQDFYPLRTFWKELKSNEDQECEVIGAMDRDRLHPCSLFVKRKILEKTSRDFSAKPPEYDHFGLIQQELESMEVKKGLISERHFVHMNGLSHNFNLITGGGMPNYKPREFYAYIIRTLQVEVPKSGMYADICGKYINRASPTPL